MTIYDIIKKILSGPSVEVNKHAVCLDLLDMLERNGAEINSELVEALHQGEDFWANNIVNNEISKIEEKNKEHNEHMARSIERLKSIPGLPSIGREVSDEELDAAMTHGLNNMVVKTPEEEEMLKKAMAEQEEMLKKAFHQEMQRIQEQNKGKPHLIPKFKAGDKAWSPYQLICSSENPDQKWDVEEVKIIRVDAISDDMYNPSRGVLYLVAWSRKGRTCKIHQDSLYKTKEEAENHRL